MASVVSHGLVGLAIATVLRETGTPWRDYTLAAAAAALPDIDAVGFWAGVPYGSMLGHRGVTHSFAFAALIAAIAAFILGPRLPGSRRTRLFWCLFLSMASHGLLDAITNGGLGVAFFAPFVSTRYFFPFRPVEVSPIGLTADPGRILKILRSEAVWIWIPTLLAVVVLEAGRWRPKRGGAASGD